MKSNTKPSSSNKRVGRARRAGKTRAQIRLLGVPRLQVFRSLQHIYANVIVEEAQGSKILASASSLDKELRATLKGKKTEIAAGVGKAIADRAKKAGVLRVAFDRSGFKYHGRVKALADAAREGGLDF